MAVRHVLREDLAELEDVLMQAFADDPHLEWLYPDHGAARRSWFRVALEAGRRRGHTYRSTERTGVAIWSPPGVNSLSRADGVALYEQMAESHGAAGTARLDTIAAARSTLHPTEPHFYLLTLGAATPGRGTGAELIAPVLRTCDEQAWPAYLESSSPRNVTFYERQGFVAVHEIVVDGGPALLGMWRAPMR
jgi:acetyltransferase (GNAT) family protein